MSMYLYNVFYHVFSGILHKRNLKITNVFDPQHPYRALWASIPKGLIHRVSQECAWRVAGGRRNIPLQKNMRVNLHSGSLLLGERQALLSLQELEVPQPRRTLLPITQTVITQPGNKLKYVVGRASSTFLRDTRDAANEGITPNRPIYYLYSQRSSRVNRQLFPYSFQ